jgi:DNA-binding NarL/FixJ family response regulator
VLCLHRRAVASDGALFCAARAAQLPGDVPDASLAVVGIVRDLLVHEGLVRILTASPGFEFASLRPDEPQLLRAIADADPDIVIMDAGSSPAAKVRSLELAVELGRVSPSIGVIALSIEPELDVARALLAHGAARRGYLLYDRQLGRERLFDAIRDVAAGGSAIDARVVAALVRQRQVEKSSPISSLTARQTEVLAEVARGKSNRAIAQTLRITKRSVEHHIAEIFSRLDLADGDEVSRRVAATLLHLRATSATDRAAALQENALDLQAEAPHTSSSSASSSS